MQFIRGYINIYLQSNEGFIEDSVEEIIYKEKRYIRRVNNLYNGIMANI